MRSTLLVIALTSASAVRAQQCNRDNCFRQVAGTNVQNPGSSSRLADCRAFQITTTTPAATTVTTTVTVTPAPTTTNTIPEPPPEIITVIIPEDPAPPAVTVPVYASSCSGGIRYASACSCAGITASTATAATPTITETSTVTETPTSTPCGFKIQAQGIDLSVTGRRFVREDSGIQFAFSYDDPGVTFTLDSETGALLTGGRNTFTAIRGTLAFLSVATDRESAGSSRLVICSLGEAIGPAGARPLDCTDGTSSHFGKIPASNAVLLQGQNGVGVSFTAFAIPEACQL